MPGGVVEGKVFGVWVRGWGPTLQDCSSPPTLLEAGAGSYITPQEGTQGLTGLGGWEVVGRSRSEIRVCGILGGQAFKLRGLSSCRSRTVAKASRRIAQMRGAGGGDLMALHRPYPELGLGSLSPSPPASLPVARPCAHPKPPRAWTPARLVLGPLTLGHVHDAHG